MGSIENSYDRDHDPFETFTAHDDGSIFDSQRVAVIGKKLSCEIQLLKPSLIDRAKWLLNGKSFTLTIEDLDPERVKRIAGNARVTYKGEVIASQMGITEVRISQLSQQVQFVLSQDDREEK